MSEVLNETPLISVIIPIYNVSEYLERCVKSVQRQSYKNLEIVLVDDGSTDGSGAICDDLERSDSRIKVVHQLNLGVATARNTGLDASSGEYISFVDSDDYVHPDFIKYLYSKLIENDCEISICSFIGTDSWEYSKEINWDETVDVYDRRQLLDKFYSDMHGAIIMLWNKLISRKCIDGIRFDDGFIHEDEGTTFKFLYNASRIVFCHEVLYYYYDRKGSITGNPYSVKRLDILKAYENRLEFYRTHGENELLSRECQFYLSEILNHYYKVRHFLGNDKELLGRLKEKYKKVYLSSDRAMWPMGRRMFYGICLVCPTLYGILKQG